MSFVYRAERHTEPQKEPQEQMDLHDSSVLTSKCQPKPPAPQKPLLAKGLCGLKQTISIQTGTQSQSITSPNQHLFSLPPQQQKPQPRITGSIYKSYRVWEVASPTQCSLNDSLGPGCYSLPDNWCENSKQTSKYSQSRIEQVVGDKEKEEEGKEGKRVSQLEGLEIYIPSKVESQRINKQASSLTLAPGCDFHSSKTQKGIRLSRHVTENVDYPYESLVFGYKCKNSSSFGSGNQNNKVLNTQSQIILKRIFCGQRNEKDSCRSFDNEYEFLEDRQPDPCTYFPTKTPPNIPPDPNKKHIPFLTGQTRPPLTKIPTNAGPTSYHHQLPPSKLPTPSASFKSINPRFKLPSVYPSPCVGSYNPQLPAPSDHCVKFFSLPGSSRVFFQENLNSLAPGHYDVNIADIVRQVKRNMLPQPAYRNEQERSLWGKPRDSPGPGCYEVGKGKQNQDIPEELREKKVPFLSGCDRFVKFKKEQPLENQDQQVKRKPHKLKPATKKYNFRAKTDENKDIPSVGHYFNYERSLKSWNIKSFNRLFSKNLNK